MQTGSATGGGSFPFVMLGFGAVALVLAWNIPATTVAENDPGPRAFPLALALFILAVALWDAARRVLPVSSTAVQQKGEEARGEEVLSGNLEQWHRRRFWIFCGMAGCYFVLLPWAGFFPATLLFSLGMMRMLGAGWPAAGVATLILLVLVYGLFIRLFKVPLPSNPFFSIV